jgi:hypothetical protein
LPSLLVSGDFLSKCLIVLQEVGGNFRPQVTIEVNALQEKLKNLHILASRSGMMHSNHLTSYKDEVLKVPLCSRDKPFKFCNNLVKFT